jgi:negative regulator of sigma E activity
MTAHLNEKLSALLDGELEGAELVAAEAHLEACAACRADLEGLTRVARRAASLDDRPPENDLWAGIQSRLSTPSTSDVVPLESRRRRVAFTMPQLAAAAIALMALSAGAVRMIVPGQQRSDSRLPAPAIGVTAIPAAYNPGDSTVASYDSAITGMQQLLKSRRGSLDTATARVVEQSLALIDFAIKQAREALAHDPGNMYLNGQLQRTLDRKLDVLRHAVTLPTAT